ncbi:MAG: hypothetical protein J6V72_06490 [Kiritimatiellae bacterium]|nr:hypothetical protein [Kiritimatiellia bacterium]
MKKNCITGARICSLALLAIPLAGCLSHPSPYDYVENWLVREDPIRTFVIPADVIYVQSELYTRRADVQKMQDHVRLEVGQGKFSGLARVFSPLVASPEDMESALKWYFRYHHKKDRPFVFIGEGEGGTLLREYEEMNAEELKEKGLVASYYSDEHKRGFVTAEIIDEIREIVANARFRHVWGKDMPDGILPE